MLALPWPLQPGPSADPGQAFNYLYLVAAVIALAAILGLRAVSRMPPGRRRLGLFVGVTVALALAGYLALASLPALNRKTPTVNEGP